MRFIHFADCHLASENNFSSEISDYIRKKTRKTFENILKENKDSDFALIGGDLFERSFFTTKDYQRLFDLIREFDKNIYYVTGNHDYISSDNQMFFVDKPSNLKVFSPEIFDFFEEGKVRIYGISYADRIFTKNFPFETPLNKDFFNILLIHGLVDDESSNYLNLNLESLSSMGFDYVALGHIHKPISVSHNIYYSGTIEAKNFSEDLNYGYIVYEDGNIIRKQVSELKFTEISLKTSDYSNQEDLIFYIKNILKNKINFLRLILEKDSDLQIDKNKIKNSLNLFYLEVREEKSYDIESLVSMYPNSLLSRFVDQTANYKDDEKILKRAKELGLDAILRSHYD